MLGLKKQLLVEHHPTRRLVDEVVSFVHRVQELTAVNLRPEVFHGRISGLRRREIQLLKYLFDPQILNPHCLTSVPFSCGQSSRPVETSSVLPRMTQPGRPKFLDDL